MANPNEDPKPQQLRLQDTMQRAELDSAQVHLTEGNRLQVEFRIADLIKRLVPGGLASGSCGGCNGCSGCSM